MLEFEKYKVDVGKLEREFDEGVRKFEWFIKESEMKESFF